MKRLKLLVVLMSVFVLLSLTIGTVNQAVAKTKFTNTCSLTGSAMQEVRAMAGIKFVNQSSVTVRVYIDGFYQGLVAPGYYQIVVANQGSHDLNALSINTNPVISWAMSIWLDENGYTWILY